ncbi:hypothetical protein NPIL_92511 [Nephila pilipes]|uniref:Uncharacterized protein n=1 Tax=Nephila pilipes TaxID=299642 RepID=A0A8X6PAT9_NEPPI|nr:hypothetical protein NPIL_92511 [Nephila pilipes]
MQKRPFFFYYVHRRIILGHRERTNGKKILFIVIFPCVSRKRMGKGLPQNLGKERNSLLSTNATVFIIRARPSAAVALMKAFYIRVLVFGEDRS